MIHPDTALRWISDDVGFGVFATQDIPRGTITWVLDDLDLRFSPERVQALGEAWAPTLLRFGFYDAEGNVVVSWDHARFVNHSCDPSTASGGDDRFEVALRDIKAGEQITDDYRELYLPEAMRFACRCGAARCVRDVHGRSGAIPAERQALVQAALDLAPQVSQPLAPMASGALPIESTSKSPRRRRSARAAQGVARVVGP